MLFFAEQPDPGGCTRTEYPDGKKVIVFTSGNTRTEYPDGMEVTESPSGQTETACPDGREETVYEDGKKRTKYPDGRESTLELSGELQTKFPDGTTEIVTPNGVTIPRVLEASRSPLAAEYQDCDARAVQAQGGSHWGSVKELAEHLAQPFRGDPEKMARVMFRWVAHNVAYDIRRLREEKRRPDGKKDREDSQSPETVMREGLAVCEGYSKLLCAMCDAIGVHCKFVGGQGRGGTDDRSPKAAPPKNVERRPPNRPRY